MTDLDKKLEKAARECSEEAVRRTFEAGLPITILVGNRIVRRWADGREELVKELPPRDGRPCADIRASQLVPPEHLAFS